MFKKLLASIGIGNAHVDTRLADDTLSPGEMVAGEVHMRGGEVAQEIDSIYIYLATKYRVESGDTTVSREHILVQHPLSERFTLGVGETRTVSFSFGVPYTTPLTMGTQRVYVRTGLAISSAIDPGDTDQIQVGPHPLQERVLQAVQNLGFQLYSANAEYSPKLGRGQPFVQEFEFKPYGKWSSRLKELELIFYLSPNSLDVYLELDRRERGLMALLDDFDMNERYAHFTVTSADLIGSLETRLDQLIDERSRR
ncbi:MAG: sporulation protein [Chloroflexaceae bacterium]|jgi:sporulation-control protein|nr:sporulation protein [Chloroflexaceae bacterium]